MKPYPADNQFLIIHCHFPFKSLSHTSLGFKNILRHIIIYQTPWRLKKYWPSKFILQELNWLGTPTSPGLAILVGAHNDTVSMWPLTLTHFISTVLQLQTDKSLNQPLGPFSSLLLAFAKEWQRDVRYIRICIWSSGVLI